MIAVDTETTSLYWKHGATVFAIGSYDGTTFHSQRCSIDPLTRQRTQHFDTKLWRERIEQHDLLVMQNASFDIKALCEVGVYDWDEPREPEFWDKICDTSHLTHLYDSSAKRSLKKMAADMGEDYEEVDELDRIVKRVRIFVSNRKPDWQIAHKYSTHPAIVPCKTNTSWHKMDMWICHAVLQHFPASELKAYFKEDYDKLHTVLLDYLKKDCVSTYDLAGAMFYSLVERHGDDLTRLLSINSKIRHIIWGIENDGVTVKPDRLEDAIEVCTEEAERMLSECKALSGRDILNDNTVRDLLFTEWQHAPINFTKPSKKFPKGNYAVDVKSLIKLRRSLPEDHRVFVGKWITYKKYTKKLEMLTGYRKASLNGVLFPLLNSVGTKTTRFSSSDPNGQNIEKKPPSFDDDEDINEWLEKTPGSRSVFGPPKGKWWVAMDYSQLQLRIFAVVTGEKDMQKAFAEGWDGHDYTMHKIFSDVEEHTELHRRIAKNCYHPDTEVLTTTGWKLIVDVLPSDRVAQYVPGRSPETGVIEYVEPTGIVRQANAHGHLLHFKSEGFDLRVTPDHRMFSWDQKCNAIRKGKYDYSITPASELPLSRMWSNAGTEIGIRDTDIPAIHVRLAAAIQADGSIAGNRIRFGFVKQQKIERLEKLLNHAGVSYKKSVIGREYKVTTFSFHVSSVTESLKLLDNKVWVIEKLLQLGLRMRQVLLEEIGYWDAALVTGKCTQTRYYSSIKQNVDAIQAVATVSNRKTRLVRGKKGIWCLSIKQRCTTKQVNRTPEIIPYTGEVVCLSVPSSLLVVRDGGIPVISGNCNFGFIFGASPSKIEETAGRPGLWDVVTSMFPNAHGFIEQTKKSINSSGYVNTLGNYPLRMDLVQNKYRGNWEYKAHAGVNYIVQGTEGVIVKEAIFRCGDYLIKHRFGGRICMLIHDEIVFEVPAFVKRSHLLGLKKCMEDAAQMYGVHAPVDGDLITHVWAEKKGLDLGD